MSRPLQTFLLSEVAWIFVFSFILSAAAAGVYLRWARRNRVLDHPSDRSSHFVPTPRGGGVAIALTVLTGVAWWEWREGGVHFPLRVAGAAGLLLAMISWIDDLRGLSALLRLILQLLLGVGTAGAFVASADGSPILPAAAATVILTLWIVAHVNIYNFMDGIDGIASSQAAVAGFAWFVCGWWCDLAAVAWAGAILCAACLGFLVFNWSPAKLFMGDVGSAFLGFTVAVLPLLSGPAPRLEFFIFAVAASWPFLFDASVTLLRRAANGENLLEAHRSHYYQQLARGGWPHSRVTLMYVTWAVVCAAAGLAWIAQWTLRGPLLACGLLLPAAALVWLARMCSQRPSPFAK